MDKLINLGKSVQIKGELRGDEDLTIEGRIDGKIVLGEHALTIGPNGQIKAEIKARSVVVAGELVGNITATDKVEVAPTGSVLGDLRAPRVVLADGARFRGSIDMEPQGAGRVEPKSTATSATTAGKPVRETAAAAAGKSA
jgi:cytoskeletal protein CcmA (bactofilin family)